MSTPVRAQDREHLSIVQESLARDGLHVAMVAHDRRRLQDYAGALARALAGQAGNGRLRIEAYDPGRLESLIVDLMLHRFDAALSDISGAAPQGASASGWRADACRPGCVLFVPDAQVLSRAEFRQLLRIAAGTRRNGLRLVALFDADSPACDERIAEMGTQVARWDLDDDTEVDVGRSILPWRRGRDSDTSASRFAPATGVRNASHHVSPSLRWPQSSLSASSHRAQTQRGLARNHGRWLAAASVAAALALLPNLMPSLLLGLLTSLGNEALLTPAVNHSVTRSGVVELAGEPRRDFVRAAILDAERGSGDGERSDAAGIEPPDNAGVRQPAVQDGGTEAMPR